MSACPTCPAEVSPGDAFCESCGAALHDEPISPPGSQPCTACGGDVLADGWCSTCGQKERPPRDHWSEAPAPWVGGVCDRGILHARNEDAMSLAAPDDRTAVLVVCDGVTTAPDSDRAALAAARAATSRLVAAMGARANATPADEGELRASAAEANSAAVGIAHTLGDPIEPPSCTFVAVSLAGADISWAWCGDSRAYWLPDGAVPIQLTMDHSLGTEMIRGGMSREEAEADPTCHTITRWLGADSVDPTPEVGAMALTQAGWLLVCSDGLWNYASTPEHVAELVAEHASHSSDPVVIAEALVAWGNEQGGHDNITATLARISPSVS